MNAAVSHETGISVSERRGGVGPAISVRRGQTEPLAALIALSVLAGAISLYSGALTGFVAEIGTERELADATANSVWEHLSTDGIYEDSTNLATSIPATALPDGHHVYLNVTYVDESGETFQTGQVQFGVDGAPTQTVDIPHRGDVFARPIPVQHRDGDIRPGTLTVVVWDDG